MVDWGLGSYGQNFNAVVQADRLAYPSLSGPSSNVGSSSRAVANAPSLDALFDYPEPSIDFAPIRDALIGQIASFQQNSTDMLAWAKERATQMDATLKPFVDASLKALETSTARADMQFKDWEQNYRPLQQKVAQEAGYGLTSQAREDAAVRAGQDVAAAHDANLATINRQMGELGVDSGRYLAGIQARAGMDKASQTAGAMTRAREQARAQGLDTAYKVGQSGNALAEMSRANQALALGAGQNAVNAQNATSQAELGMLDQARGWAAMGLQGNQSLLNSALDVYKTGLTGRMAAAQALGQQQTMPRVGAAGGGTIVKGDISAPFGTYWPGSNFTSSGLGPSSPNLTSIGSSGNNTMYTFDNGQMLGSWGL